MAAPAQCSCSRACCLWATVSCAHQVLHPDAALTRGSYSLRAPQTGLVCGDYGRRVVWGVASDEMASSARCTCGTPCVAPMQAVRRAVDLAACARLATLPKTAACSRCTALASTCSASFTYAPLHVQRGSQRPPSHTAQDAHLLCSGALGRRVAHAHAGQGRHRARRVRRPRQLAVHVAERLAEQDLRHGLACKGLLARHHLPQRHTCRAVGGKATRRQLELMYKGRTNLLASIGL